MSEKIVCVNVILALHLPSTYTYRVPEKLVDKMQIGQRVVVQLRKKIYSAIVVEIIDDWKPTTTNNNTSCSPRMELKYVLDIIDKQPIVTDKQIKFFNWIANYYIAYIGDVLTAALPASLRLKSETIVTISPYFNSDISSLNKQELEVFNFVVSKDKISLEDIKADLDNQNILKIVNKLIRQDILITDEELYSRYTPKKETYLTLNQEYKDKDKLKVLLDGLDKSKKTQPQADIILKYLSLTQGRDIVKRSELEDEGCNSSTINTLLKKDILVKQSIEISRLKLGKQSDQVENIQLNSEQQLCFDNIVSNLDTTPIHLIYGVTGSGKTEIYIKLIDRALKQGGQVLYLIPEIAITTQLIKRLEKYFGGKVAVYNSKFSTMERAEIWQRTMTDNKDKQLQIILGSRSSVFLPFTNLQLVIIDEEHDTSFKQSDHVPHYNGRDCALYLAKLFNATTILGSATPNIETMYLATDNAETNTSKHYMLHTLTKQFHDVPLPDIELVDMRMAKRENLIKDIFSVALLDEISSTLNNKKQVIIFQNRRGYAPHIECNVCGYIPSCPNCDVALVLHKDKKDLECHYCGYHIDALSYCPQCQSHSVRLVGYGTQKIEEQLEVFFPDAKIKRMDLDSTRLKDSYNNIITDFANHKIDILCGTQIITKGLDFENVSLVGVLGTDTMLHYPDFRSNERAFQILTQVSGRAGRKGKQGKVLIQTYETGNPLLQNVVSRDYWQMYDAEIKERQMMNFPPFCKIIKITLQHKDKTLLETKSMEYTRQLRKIFGGRLFGPQTPVIEKIRNYYAKEIWIKIEKKLSYQLAKQKLREYNEEFLVKRENCTIRISIDVDPV
jgi:primosomal protein N' (replication factor Y) (superfamily II helicase)